MRNADMVVALLVLVVVVGYIYVSNQPSTSPARAHELERAAKPLRAPNRAKATSDETDGAPRSTTSRLPLAPASADQPNATSSLCRRP